MVEKIRNMRLNVTFGALLVLITGILFLIYPGEIVTTVARITGLLIAMVGISQVAGKLLFNVNRSSGMLVGTLIAVVGFWIFLNPEVSSSILPIIIGVVLVIHGIQNISLSFVGRGYRMGRWYMPLLGGVLNIICGMLCIAYAFGIVKFALQLFGAMLIYDGITSMITVVHVNSSERNYIDVEYIETDISSDDTGNPL